MKIPMAGGAGGAGNQITLKIPKAVPTGGTGAKKVIKLKRSPGRKIGNGATAKASGRKMETGDLLGIGGETPTDRESLSSVFVIKD